MAALYEKSQNTQILISAVPVTAATVETAEYLSLSCALKEANFTGGQKQDIDVTTLCSVEQENINGLPSPSEIALSGNFYRNQAQDALRSAYDDDTTYGFKIIFPSGNGFMFLSEVRQHTWSTGTNGVVAATFSLRLKGKPTYINAALPLVINTDLPPTKSATTGGALTMSVEVLGGIAPYAYKWMKGSTAVSGQTAVTFNKSSAVAGDAGVYTCQVSDSATPANMAISAACTVTIE